MSQTLKGIDVSYANGTLNWTDLAKQVDFAMIRGGYSTTPDDRADANFRDAAAAGVPVGAYWFSYATNVEAAQREAEACITLIKKYKITLPVAFDFEYASVDYAEKQGVKITSDLLCAMARRFLDRIRAAGYTPMLYTNVDFLGRGFSKLADEYLIWLAHWGVSKPGRNCYMWQYTDKLRLKGRVFDGDELFGQIPEDPEKPVVSLSDATRTRFYENAADDYFAIAEQILRGEWGNGDERKKRLKDAGYDYTLAQAMVNAILNS